MSSSSPTQEFTAVIGAGSWGTALASVLARSDTPTILWGRSQEHVRTMAKKGENQRYLPGIPLPKSLRFSDDLAQTVEAVQQS